MRREKARATLTLCSIALAGVVITGCAASSDGVTASQAANNAGGQCSRETLQKLADTYISAQKAGTPAAVPLAANGSYVQNDQVTDISKGVLAEALTVDFTRSFHDTTQCATFTELVAATHSHPYVIHTRMEATRDGKVSKIESVVTG